MTMLEGITVLDLSRLIAGPYAAMVLAQYGARVIKVETLSGEEGRSFGPPFCGDTAALFLQTNRAKESLALDLRKPRGREVLEKLVARADVLIHSFRPDFAERTRLRFEDLVPLNPRLIHYTVTAYGSDSPYRLKPAVDSVVQGMAGGFYGAGEECDPPIRNSLPVVDVASGMCGAMGVMAALLEREKSGHGQKLELALIDTMLNFLGSKIAEATLDGRVTREINPAIVAPSRHFQAADGRWFTVSVINDAAFARLCKVIGRPEWARDRRYCDNAGRVAHRPLLLPALAEVFATRPAQDWLQALEAADIPAGPVNTVQDMLADPALYDRLAFQTEVPGLPMPELPVRLARGQRSVAQLGRAPGLGEHSARVLAGAGYAPDEIRALAAEGVTRLGGPPRLDTSPETQPETPLR
ncbi:CaiB/BaiF CoA transferase family protein [Sinimarinibacterium flocculans]|uniref:CaiB/BaiF CoA transferase family protein n=1 Tax=Sinimarinibacterium flocculans TaxID=985250 RepID=UPI0035159497